MSNSRIFQASYPAERMRGCKFATDFRDPLVMARDGWTALGAPLYHPDGGVILNGTTQHLIYPLAGELNSANLTIHAELWPTFDYTDNAYHYLFDSTARVYVRKLDNAGANVLEVKINGTTIATVAAATYGPLWRTNGRNLLSISASAAGANLVCLNGTQIATSATAWVRTDSALFYLGTSTVVAFGRTAARYTRLYIQHNTSTLQEHLDIWNKKTWKWEEALSHFFPFTTGCYDPTNKRTLDGRTSSLYATLGDGARTGEPTQGRGHLVFDGVNDYLSGIADPAGSFTVMGVKDTGTGWTFFSDNDLTNWTPIFTSGGFTGKLSYLAVAPSVLTETQELDAQYKWISTIGSKI